VRLPKECRLDGKEVFVKKIGNLVVLYPKEDVWSLFEQSLEKFPDDFMDDREQPPMRKPKVRL